MQIFRTPAQMTDYNLKLTKAEVIAFSTEGDLSERIKLLQEFYGLMNREAKKLGDKQSTARP